MSTNTNRFERLYLSPPHMSDEGYELEFVKEAFASNWIAPIGPHVNSFETEFASLVGLKYGAAVSSGTAALHLLLRILGVKSGDDVICSSFTFFASATPIVYEGASPVFIDSDERTWNMDPNLLEDELRRAAAVGKLPKAVIVVDLYGQMADLPAIAEICERYGVTLIEDAAEAIGATLNGRPAGSFGVAGVFSFNGNKIITTSGGGMLVSNDQKLIEQTRFLSQQARDPFPYYHHTQIGYNYRMSNVVAAIGRGQLKVLDQRVAKRRANFAAYVERLSDLPGISFMPEPEGYFSTRWLTCATIDPKLFGATYEDVRLKLEFYNIESRPLWKPLHLQPVFDGCRMIGGKVCETLFSKGICLPSGSSMSDGDLDRVCEIIRAIHLEAQASKAGS